MAIVNKTPGATSPFRLDDGGAITSKSEMSGTARYVVAPGDEKQAKYNFRKQYQGLSESALSPRTSPQLYDPLPSELEQLLLRHMPEKTYKELPQETRHAVFMALTEEARKVHAADKAVTEAETRATDAELQLSVVRSEHHKMKELFMVLAEDDAAVAALPEKQRQAIQDTGEALLLEKYTKQLTLPRTETEPKPPWDDKQVISEKLLAAKNHVDMQHKVKAALDGHFAALGYNIIHTTMTQRQGDMLFAVDYRSSVPGSGLHQIDTVVVNRIVRSCFPFLPTDRKVHISLNYRQGTT